MTIIDMPLKRRPKVKPDFTEWDFDDEQMPKTVHRFLCALLAERMEQIFSKNGVTAGLWIDNDSDHGRIYIRCDVSINEDDCFMSGSMDLFEALHEIVQSCTSSESAERLSSGFRKLSELCDVVATDFRDGGK